MTFRTNQLLYSFYTLCRQDKAAGLCDGKQTVKMYPEKHCTAHNSSSWGVAVRPWCGHCPAHSHLGRNQLYTAQAVSVLRISDSKQQSTTGREKVAILCVCAGRPQRGNIWTRHIFLRDRAVDIILNRAEFYQSLDATEVRSTWHHFFLHFFRRRLERAPFTVGGNKVRTGDC